jgi:hypothetical protein
MTNTDSKTNHTERDKDKYYNSLSEKEKKAFLIAENHLGSLFNIEKTAGFLQWKAKR